MFVERWGDGPRRFLGLHGWSGDHRTFETLAELIPLECSFFSADLPGYGRSPPPTRWTVDELAWEVADLIQELAAPRLTLVGNCSGGLLALCSLVSLGEERAGHLVERLVLIDLLAYWPWYFRVFTTPGWGRYAYQTRKTVSRNRSDVWLRGTGPRAALAAS